MSIKWLFFALLEIGGAVFWSLLLVAFIEKIKTKFTKQS